MNHQQSFVSGVSALSPNPMQGIGMLKKPLRVRDTNSALQVRLRSGGRAYFINRLGRFDDPVTQARGQAICAEVWRDAQERDLDLSLNRYCLLVEGRDQDLLDALRSLAEEKKQASTQSTILSTIRSVQPVNKALGLFGKLFDNTLL
jgi:hypothetical protein